MDALISKRGVRISPDYVPTEDEEQMTLVQWMSYNNIPHFHIPNGTNKTFWQAKRFKKLGLKSGIPDLMIPVAKGKFHGLFVEMKRKKKYNISPTQQYWLDKLNEYGYLAVACAGFMEAKKVIWDYLHHENIVPTFEDITF